jgi:hypothetical protein
LLLPLSLRRRIRGLGALFVVALLPACEDGPAGPGVYTHPADGRTWIAVEVPEATPTLRTWLPYVRQERSVADSALDQVRALTADADRLRRAGNLEAASEAEAAAMLLAARSLTQHPPAHVLTISLAALQQWSDRAAAALAHGDFHELAGVVLEVRARRTAAVQALQQGDTAAAVVEIATGSSLVHAQSPEAVAARALLSAERRLASLSLQGADAARATRLLRHARESLAAGDQMRALRRALYALQLAESVGVASGEARTRPELEDL